MTQRLKPVRTVAPAAALLDLDVVKSAVRIDHDDDNELIFALMQAAEQMLDGYAGILGRPLITQTWREDFAQFSYRLPLRLRDVQSVASITYYDADNVQQTVDASDYRLHESACGAYLVQREGQSWPSAYPREDAVSVTYLCGFGDAASDVPQPIRRAATMLVGHWFDAPEMVGAKAFGGLPPAVRALLTPYRTVRAFYT
jgi:uncharacterized phiE125 gp8 family phage protein